MAAVVPAVPQSAINAVADPNVRQVLQAMSDGIAVRNGDVGSGDNAFLTLASLKGKNSPAAQIAAAVAPALAAGITGQVGGAGPATGTITAMNSLADALQDRILNSAAWQNMFSKLTMIAAPGDVPGSFAASLEEAAQQTGSAIQEATTVTASAADVTVLKNSGIVATVGSSVAATTLESSYRANKDNALASAINTIWASIGGNIALIQDGQLASVNATGATATAWQQLQASVGNLQTSAQAQIKINQTVSATASTVTGLLGQWSVKMDLSTPTQPYVAGVSLNSQQSPNGVNSSSFIVLADVFAVGSPNLPNIVPFAIDASTGLVAIRGDLVVKKSITADSLAANTITANSGVIANAAVQTLMIGNNAVTVPASVSGSGGGTFAAGGSMTIIPAGTLNVSYPSGASTTPVQILVTWQTSAQSSGGNSRVEVHMDGSTVVLAQSDTAPGGNTSSHVASKVVQVAPGNHQFTLWFGNDWTSGTWSLVNWSFTVLGTMR